MLQFVTQINNAFWFADASLSMWSVKAYYTLWPDVFFVSFKIVNVECERMLHFVTRSNVKMLKNLSLHVQVCF